MNKYECPKCEGKKTIGAFSHVKGGVCFKCGGTGFVEQKTSPTKSKLFTVYFLWTNPEDVNYMAGEFCKCGNIKARNLADADRKAKSRMITNGSVDYRVVEV